MPISSLLSSLIHWLPSTCPPLNYPPLIGQLTLTVSSILTTVSMSDSNDLCLCVLHYKHDHPLSGHFRQNWTLELVYCEYTWPGVWTFIKEYISSCTTCAHVKVPRHKPYRLFKQLLIPLKSWNSIFMDFIKQLLASSGYTTILVVVDHLSKQCIFISMDNMITSLELAKLFLLHVFSKHRVPSHITSGRGSKFVSHFF